MNASACVRVSLAWVVLGWFGGPFFDIDFEAVCPESLGPLLTWNGKRACKLNDCFSLQSLYLIFSQFPSLSLRFFCFLLIFCSYSCFLWFAFVFSTSSRACLCVCARAGLAAGRPDQSGRLCRQTRLCACVRVWFACARVCACDLQCNSKFWKCKNQSE